MRPAEEMGQVQCTIYEGLLLLNLPLILKQAQASAVLLNPSLNHKRSRPLSTTSSKLISFCIHSIVFFSLLST
jgi:hypothetical protein